MPRLFNPPETPASDAAAPSIEQIDAEIAAERPDAISYPEPADAPAADVLSGTHLESLAVLSLPAGSASQWRTRVTNVEQKLADAKATAAVLVEQGGIVELMLALGQDGAEQLALDHRASCMNARITVEGLTDAVALAKRQLSAVEAEEKSKARDIKIEVAKGFARSQIAIAERIDQLMPALLGEFHKLSVIDQQLGRIRGELVGVALPSSNRLNSRTFLEGVLSFHGAKHGFEFAGTLDIAHKPPQNRFSMVQAETGAWRNVLAIKTSAGADAGKIADLERNTHETQAERIEREILEVRPELLVDAFQDEPETMLRKSAELDGLIAERLTTES